MAVRDPCPGCGRLIAYRTKKDRPAWDTVRLSHKCPHGRRCLAGSMSVGVNWQPGDDYHARTCVYCAEAAREAARIASMLQEPQEHPTTAMLFPLHGEECDRYAARWRDADHSGRLAIASELGTLSASHAASLAVEMADRLSGEDRTDLVHQLAGAWMVEKADGGPLP